MQAPMVRIAAVSNWVKSAFPPDQVEGERVYQINNAMELLFREGCRRLRVVPMIKTGDADRYKVMGWPS